MSYLNDVFHELPANDYAGIAFVSGMYLLITGDDDR